MKALMVIIIMMALSGCQSVEINTGEKNEKDDSKSIIRVVPGGV